MCALQNVCLSLLGEALDLNLQQLVADQGGNTQPPREDVRAAAMKPDKMEETLTCIICQDLLHDCVRCAADPPAGSWWILATGAGGLERGLPMEQLSGPLWREVCH